MASAGSRKARAAIAARADFGDENCVRSLVANVGAYWLQHVLVLAAAFVTSPIAVHLLGPEAYGLWTLLVSASAVLALLDLGLHASIVRSVSRHVARGDEAAAQEAFASATVLLAKLGGLAFMLLVLASGPLARALAPAGLAPERLQGVLCILALDLALGVLGSAYLAALSALQRFVPSSLATGFVALVRAVALVWVLRSGGGLVGIACTQLGGTLLKHGAHFVLLRRSAPYLRMRWRAASPAAREELVAFGLWAFASAVASRVLLATDAIVIGRCLSLDSVTFYAVPASLLLHVETLVAAAQGVLFPWISSREARGDERANRELYLHGTRYLLLALLPILFVLYTAGGEFLRLWMGPEMAERGTVVLRILAPAAFLALPQLLAHGILRGTGRPRTLALVLAGETVLNVGLSLLLVREHGLAGVAIGTAVPLVLASLLPIALAACRAVGLGYARYLVGSHALPLGLAALLAAGAALVPVRIESYAALAAYALGVSLVVGLATLAFGLAPEHRERLRAMRRRNG